MENSMRHEAELVFTKINIEVLTGYEANLTQKIKNFTNLLSHYK